MHSNVMARCLPSSSPVSPEALHVAAFPLPFLSQAPLVGAPLDAIKSRMNADPKYLTGTAMQTFRGIVKTEGFLAVSAE